MFTNAAEEGRSAKFLMRGKSKGITEEKSVTLTSTYGGMTVIMLHELELRTLKTEGCAKAALCS